MIALNRRTKVFLSKEPADMRASYDTLFARVKDLIKEDAFSGHLFVFHNKRRTSCKCLYYDGTGLVLICKRLEQGLRCISRKRLRQAVKCRNAPSGGQCLTLPQQGDQPRAASALSLFGISTIKDRQPPIIKKQSHLGIHDPQ